MWLRLLGDVEIESGSARFAPVRSGERCVLATLALEAARPVRIDTLVEHIWGDEEPPAKAAETVATYIRSVRRLIERAGGERSWLPSRRPGSYVLLLDPEMIDYHRHRSLRAAAEASARHGDRSRALDGYERALALWRAAPLANVDGQWAERQRYAIRQEWLDTMCAALEIRLHLGQYATVAARAQQVAHDYPTERVATLALYGLSRGAQQALIPAFMARVAERMWQVAEARPTADLLALAHRLTAGSAAPAAPTPAVRPPSGRPPSGGVIMSASHNRQVWQSGGDQYITGS